MDIYFCLHDSDPIHLISKTDIGLITKNNYPLEQVIKKYGSRYFTNSISYMIAYALLKGYKQINLYGIDLDQGGEYAFERPSVAYWCGIAQGNGCIVKWDKTEPLFMYAFDAEAQEKILRIIAEKREMAIAEKGAQKNEKALDQWRGFLYALEIIEREVKS